MSDSKQNVPKPAFYKMITPLIRIKLESKEKLEFKLVPDRISIFDHSKEIFDSFNTMKFGQQSQQLFSGMDAMVFHYNPFLVCVFPYREDYPEHAYIVIDNFLKTLALFKTTNTKLKIGPRIVVTVTEENLGLMLNVRGSDDSRESKASQYELTNNELVLLQNFYNTFQESLTKLHNNRLSYALEFYTKASRTEDLIEKYIFLSLTLEMLFSREKDELGYRFSNRIALLLGDNHEQRKWIRNNVKDVIYHRRSAIVHGDLVNPPTVKEFFYLNELMRSSILRFISLILYKRNDPIHEIDDFLLKQNSEEYEKFKDDTTSLFGELSYFQYSKVKKVEELPIP